MLPVSTSSFLTADAQPWETAGPGVRRQMLVHDAQLMLVKVAFETGSVGAPHQHPHRQISYVESGVFEYTIGDDTRTMRPGDSCLVPPATQHGTVCREAGVLLDVFSPRRDDFVQLAPPSDY